MRLSNKRYEEIKREVAYIFEDYNVKSISIDVFEIAKAMNITVIYASEILKKHSTKLNELKVYEYPQSFFYYDDVIQKFYVYIDDVGTTINRQRFSMAHEIMHIRLGHTEQNPENESEANFGAQYLLSPTSLVLLDNEYSWLQEEKFIKYIFEVSDQVASISTRYNRNRLNCIDSTPKDYEEIINNQLGDSLKKLFHEIKKA